jgi:hypothetical protein
LRRLHVDDPIAKPILRTRASVVRLVRIQYRHLPRGADPRRSSIVEDLDPTLGHADGIRIVAMLRIRLAGKPGAKKFHAADRPRARDPVRGGFARSFKTLTR